MKKVLKIASWYSFFNVIIAYAFEFISPVQHWLAQAVASVLAVFINVFSYVAIPLMLVSIISAVYFFVMVLRDKEQTEAYKYMVMNVVSAASIAYFVSVAFMNVL